MSQGESVGSRALKPEVTERCMSGMGCTRQSSLCTRILNRDQSQDGTIKAV